MSLKPVSFRKPVEHAPRLSPKYEPGRKSDRFWSDEEKDIVKKHYPNGGAVACRPHLPGRTSEGIYQQAHVLGLTKKHGAGLGAKAPPKEKHDELDAAIRETWPSMDGKKRGAVNQFADELGVPRWWLTKRATKLGLTMPHKKEPNWTKAELDLLKTVPLHDTDKCSDIFRAHGFQRSAMSIRVKSTRLKLSRRYKETFSASAAGRVLGFDIKTVTRYILDGDLKATKRVTKRLPQQGGNPWSITREDLRTFIIEKLERIDFRKVDKFQLVDVLTNTKPKDKP